MRMYKVQSQENINVYQSNPQQEKESAVILSFHFLKQQLWLMVSKYFSSHHTPT